MKHIPNVKGNSIPNSIEIYSNKVIITSNVHEYREQGDNGIMECYEYDCDIYNKDEYLLVIAEQANHIAQLEDELAAAKILLGVDE